MDFLAVSKLFIAAIMCVGGVILSICFCCCLQEDKHIHVSPDFSKEIINQAESEGEDRYTNVIAIDVGEDPLPEKKSFENEWCFTVDD